MFSIYKVRKTAKAIDFKKRPLVFIDLETSGLDFLRHEILEIGCLVVDPQTLEVKKEFEVKVKPESLAKADPEALRMIGYSITGWRRAKSLKTALKELNRLAPGGMFVGWNISFDRPFLEKAAREKGIILDFDYHWLDVMSIAYERFLKEKKVNRFRLNFICEFLGIPRGRSHRAMSDTVAVLAVYRRLRQLSF